MPNRDGSPTRSERAAVRRQTFHQDRIDRTSTPVEVLHAGFLYLAAVIKQVAVVDPRKADEIAADATDFLLRQANAHDVTTTGGGRR